jgi:cell division protein FtsB
VNYLAAGGIQGLPPLRYEKRVTRNRLIAFVLFLFLMLLGSLLVFLKGSH